MKIFYVTEAGKAQQKEIREIPCARCHEGPLGKESVGDGECGSVSRS